MKEPINQITGGKNMRILFGTIQPDQPPYPDKFLFRSLTYFNTIVANFDVPSGLIFAIIN